MMTNSPVQMGYSTPRAGIAVMLAWLLAATPAVAQTPAPAEQTPQGQHLSVVIVEGEGAINNVRQRTAREPIVEVQDENHRPVAGAAVVFTVLPSNGGAGASFAGNTTTEVVTDQAGRAVARGFHPNTHAGQVQIRVTATSNGRVGSATITQTNVVTGAAAGAAAGLSVKMLVILGVAAAGAAAGGAYAATHSGGSHAGTSAAATTITPGAPSVGAP